MYSSAPGELQKQAGAMFPWRLTQHRGIQSLQKYLRVAEQRLIPSLL